MKEKVLRMLRNSEFVSGQAISDACGVSRTAVWKAIRGLQEEGCEIEAVRNKGYRLISEPNLLLKSQIASYLDTEWAASELLVFDEVDSTNNVAKIQAEKNAPHGTLVVSDVQTAGRGRRGRPWQSPAGTGIWMSLLIRPDIEPRNASMLTLVMALAVRSGIEQIAGISCGIKWPNDIVGDGKKVCGILTEMSAEPDCVNHIVIGVGINVLDEAFPEDIRDVAASIYGLSGEKINRSQLIALIMKEFERVYAEFIRTQDLSGLLEEYNRYLLNTGREVRVLDPAGAYTGTSQGIDKTGRLIVDTGSEVKKVVSGEVSVRGIYGYV